MTSNTELQKAIKTVEFVKNTVWRIAPENLDIVLSAAKQLQQVEKEKYEQRQLAAVLSKVANEMEKERDELLLAWNGSLEDIYDFTGKVCKTRTEQRAALSQLRADFENAVEAVKGLLCKCEINNAGLPEHKCNRCRILSTSSAMEYLKNHES